MAKIQNTQPGQFDLVGMPGMGKDQVEISVPPCTMTDTGPVNGVAEIPDDVLASILAHPFTKGLLEAGKLILGDAPAAATAGASPIAGQAAAEFTPVTPGEAAPVVTSAPVETPPAGDPGPASDQGKGKAKK